MRIPDLLEIPIPQDLIDHHLRKSNYQLRWMRTENFDSPTWRPDKPLLVGGLIYDTRWNEKRLDRKQQPIWALPGLRVYRCATCDGDWIDKRPLNLISTPNCPDCVKKAIAEARRKSCKYDFVGQRFGWLKVLERTVGGWLVRCDCEAELVVPTEDLRKLRKLACPTCCPDEWRGIQGRVPSDSVHYWLKRKHLAGVDATIVP